MLNIVGILVVIFLVRPWVVIPTIVLGVVFVFLRKFYMASSRNIKRLEKLKFISIHLYPHKMNNWNVRQSSTAVSSGHAG